VRRVHELLNADDAVFVAHSGPIADAQTLCNFFSAACTEFGLKINLSKLQPYKSVVLVQGVPDPVTISMLP